jgi:oxygen-dependent protoporphyrinogen oxidase
MRVAIIGAGLSGLATAHGLASRGHEVVVLEAANRAGGTLRTFQRDGFLLEAAANGYLDREPTTRTLVAELGLSARTRPAAPEAGLRFVFTRGALRPIPMSPPKFLTSDLLPLGAKLRVAGELFSRRGDGADESIAQFGRRHLGRRATAVLVDALQTGIFAGDVEKLSLPAAFPRMAELEREHRSLVLGLIRESRARHRRFQTGTTSASRAPGGVLTSFDGGMQTLVDALAAFLGDRLRLGAEARSLRRVGAAGWTVQLGQAPVAEVNADAVVLATPSWISATLLRPLEPEAADCLESIPYAPVNVVHLAFERLAGAPRGFGFLVPSEEKRRILGAMFIHSFFPWRAPEGGALLTVMVGGARQPQQAALDNGALTSLVREELRAMLGLDAEPTFVEIVRWPRGIPQYELGHLARMARIDGRLSLLPNLHLAGHAYRGVGVNECIKHGVGLADSLGGRG